MSIWSRQFIKLEDGSLHPPALPQDADDASEIPWVLLEDKAYVANTSNDTTACSYSKCGKRIQATFVVARPPRVSYICVFCGSSPEESQEMIPLVPRVIAAEDSIVLLSIIVSPEKDIEGGSDLYIYRPFGPRGPLLSRLARPPGDRVFIPSQVGLLSCPTGPGGSRLSFLRPHPADEHYMVAALCDDDSMPGRGRFVLYLYNYKFQTWSSTIVTVEDQQLLQYQQDGYFLHINTKVIAIGGEYGTVAFVDLWRGILLCDLFRVSDSPRLRYIPLPESLRTDEKPMGEPRLSRDIAVVNGHFKYIQQQLLLKPCPDFSGQYIKHGWISALWTRPVPAASSLLEDSWDTKCKIESYDMDVDNNPDLRLLPKLQDDGGRPPQRFERLHVFQPTLGLHDDDHTACFMIKINPNDHKAWVIVVDMMKNRLQGVAEFTSQRYTVVGFAYKHFRISKYLKSASGTKGNLKREGMPLPGSANKKQPSTLVLLDAEREVVAEGGDKMMMG